MATGELPRPLDRERAGFISREFDEMRLENIVADPEALRGISRLDLAEKAGAQGTEFLTWMMMRGALGDQFNAVTQDYLMPICNGGAGRMRLDRAA